MLSSGEQVANPTRLSKWRRRLARQQAELARRQAPAKGRRASKRCQQSKARLARTHRKMANARIDGLHKLTTRLAKTHRAVAVEDLAIKGVTAAVHGRGRRGKAGLNRAVADAGFGELRRKFANKTAWNGSRLVVADRWYPSSRTCPACKAVKTKLPLTEGTYRCNTCGLVIDWDHNAALNLASLIEAMQTGTASGAGTSTPPKRGDRGNAQGEAKYMGTPRCASTNCEDSTPPTGQTATAIEQSTAARNKH